MSNLDAELGLKFSKPKIVMTKFGERVLRTSPMPANWWDVWNARKPELKAAGYSCSKDYESGQWSVTHWSQTMSKADREAAAEESRATDAAIVIPRGQAAIDAGHDYLPFQKAGVAYALKRDGTLIGDDMGLGKTIQAIGVANITKPRKVLVVCPATLLSNWRNEISKWQTLDLPVYVIRPGANFQGKADGWYVLNYDIVHRYESVLKSVEWDLSVYDECHVLKTKTARRTVVLLGGLKKNKETGVRQIYEAVKAKRRLMLTGTPILNRPKEIYTILHSLDPERWGSWSSFTRRYCAGRATEYGWDPDGASNLDELNARLRETVMVRRIKKDVLLELPPKTRQVVPIDFEGDARATAAVARELEVFERAEAAVAEAHAQAQRAEAEGDEAAYDAAVGKLREAESVAFAEMSKVRHETAVAKIPYVLEHLRNIEPGTKVVVMAHHKDVVAAICEGMAERGVVSITGDTKQEHRDPIVQQFQRDPKVEIFVGNMKAAGVGITLTASNHVIFAELDWTPGIVTQAEDRCHRIGQVDTVLVQHIVLDGSLDARMAKMLVDKQAVIDRALDKKVASTEKDVPITVVAEAGAVKDAKVPVTFDAKRKALDDAAAKLTPEQIAAIHQALRTVAAYDADRARELNGWGFSKMDTMFGNDLAAQPSLRPRQAAAAMKMVRKYKRQYDERLYAVIFGQAEEQGEAA